METFNYVKNAFETIRIHNRRLRDLSVDIETCYRNNEDVRIVYDTDVEENKDTVSKIWRIGDDSILLRNLKMIPLRAIRKVEVANDTL